MAMRMVNSSGKSKIYLFKGLFFQFYISLLAAQQKHLKNSDLFLMSPILCFFNICFLAIYALTKCFARLIEFAQMLREKKDLSFIFFVKVSNCCY